MQKMILKRLESNCYGSRSIEIYGSAYHLYNHGEPTLDDKIKCINNAVRNAQFFEPETPAKTVALNMCHLLLTDPMLIQAYVGGAYMVGVRIPNIGEILLNLASVIYSEGVYYISGHDDKRNHYTLQCSHISIQDDLSAHYGWANIMGYWTGSKFIACPCYSSIS